MELDPGIDSNDIWAAGVFDGDLVAGGPATAGDVVVNGIARWDGVF